MSLPAPVRAAVGGPGGLRPTLEVRLTRDADQVDPLMAEWAELADRCQAGPFARPSYALSWWRHFGAAQRGSRLLIATVRRDGRLVALAPLHERRWGPFLVTRWLGHGLGTVAEALVLPDDEASEYHRVLWTDLMASPGRLLQLIECREGRSGLDVLRDVVPGVRAELRARDRCPVLMVTGDAARHLADPSRSRIRRTVRVAQRRLLEAGRAFRVRVAADLDEFESLLPAVRAVVDASERSSPKQHLLRPPYAGFTLSYLRDEMAARRSLVFVGFIDQRPVSVDLVLLANGTMHSWIGRFDPAVAAFSPGHLLQCAGIDWAAEHGHPRIDLLVGDDDYKRRWATGSYGTVDVTAVRRTTWPAAAGALRIIRGVRAVGDRVRHP